MVGCHVNPLREDLLPGVLDYHAELGSTQIGCDIEFYPYGDVDYVKRRWPGVQPHRRAVPAAGHALLLP